jgi:hypothetical protein
MRKTLMIAAALAAAGPAFASGDRDESGRLLVDAPRSEWMSVAEVAAMMEQRGYTVREIETERGAYEVEATDANGLRVEAVVHPVTGEILPYEGDD